MMGLLKWKTSWRMVRIWPVYGPYMARIWPVYDTNMATIYDDPSMASKTVNENVDLKNISGSVTKKKNRILNWSLLFFQNGATRPSLKTHSV